MLKPAERARDIPQLFFAGLNRRIAELSATGADVIRLDAGSPDLPPDNTVIETLKQYADDPSQHGYGGYAGQPYFRQAIIEYYDRRFGVELEQEELQPLIGSKEGLVNMHLAWLDPDDVSLVPDPGYVAYSTAPLLANAHFARYSLLPERGWLPDLDAISVLTAETARMMWINYPNNPTGAVATREFLTEVVAFCRGHNILLCHDAPYMDVTYDGHEAISVLEISGAKEIAIEFNSFSKTYNMAGWRVGMAVGNPVAIEALARVKTQIDSGIAKPIQQMATNALTIAPEWIAKRNEIYQQRRDMCLAALAQMGLQAFKPKGGLYIWFQVPTGYSSAEFQTQLLEEAHVSIAPGNMYGPQGEGWGRISFVCDTPLLEQAMERIQKFLVS